MLLLTVGVSGNIVKVFHFTIGPTMNFILQPWQLLFMILAGILRWHRKPVAKKWGTIRIEESG